jgi:serum/glucocorticoid-regulated kinase 2
LQALKVIEK